MAKYNSFEEMEVYQKSLQFGVEVYKLTLSNEKIAKDYGLKDQLQRAALSISNNIAEGFERETKKELIRFLYISKGSAGECRNMFNFLQLLEYINPSDITWYERDSKGWIDCPPCEMRVVMDIDPVNYDYIDAKWLENRSI